MYRKKYITAEQSVGTSILVSLSDIVLNLTVAVFTQSAVLLSQALQGLADLTTALLLLVGVKRSKRIADAKHPLGFGREVFFWSLLAGIFALVVTGGFAVAQGINQLINPNNIHYRYLALMMLSFGLVTNAYSMHISLKRLGMTFKTADAKLALKRIVQSSLVETKATLLVDTMGTLSAIVGFVSILTFIITGEVIFDAIGAITIGMLTISGAGFLIFNVRDFIIGISPSKEVIEKIKSVTLSVKGVQDVLDLRVLTIGSGKLLVIVEAHFADNLNTDQIELITDKIKDRLKKQITAVHTVQVEAETPEPQ